MKRIYTLLIALIPLCSVHGQGDNQEFTIPLSSPGEEGTLYAQTHRGSVVISAHNRNDVIVSVQYMEDEEDRNEDENKDLGGLKRIPNTAAQFEITEEDNVVKVQGVHNRHLSFNIMVPEDFNLVINTHHDGYIEVNGVNGEIEADGHHEDILLRNVGGSVIADTHHGEIKVVMSGIADNIPMAFSTYHGDIDVTFPTGINASTKVKTTKGDIYTDFDLNLRVEPTAVIPDSKKGTKIKVGGWLQGDLGSGGPEFLFSTYHGDIIIRKKG